MVEHPQMTADQQARPFHLPLGKEQVERDLIAVIDIDGIAAHLGEQLERLGRGLEQTQTLPQISIEAGALGDHAFSVEIAARIEQALLQVL
jgi:hypothetical protein